MLFRFLLYAFVLSTCLTNCLCRLNSTANENYEFLKLFKLYNKPAVRVIKTVNGDTYNCVDFYKQSAFDHPLLKNHSYHPEMNSSPLSRQSNVSKESSSVFKNLWVNGEGCPVGTIPVRKYTKEQFIRTHKLFQKLYPSDQPLAGRYRACVHTQNGPHKFYGTSASLSVYNYGVSNRQYTAGYIMIRAGDDQFQVGWMINPALYGDGNSRLFLTTKVGDSKCFNLACGGYVHTNKDIPIDSIFKPATTRGAKQSLEITPKIVKDPKTHVWNLYGSTFLLGYWPTQVLKGLQGPAEYLEWGGEAYNPDSQRGPGMGSGFFPERRPWNDGYARQIVKYDETGKYSTLENSETELYSDNNKYYTIIDGGNVDVDRGHIIYYGGPGNI